MENKSLKYILSGLVIVLVIVSAIIGGISMWTGGMPTDDRQVEQLGIIAYNKAANECQCNPDKSVETFANEELKALEKRVVGATDVWVGWAKFLFGLAIVVTLVMLVVSTIKDPEGFVRRLIMIGAFLLLMVIVYFATRIGMDDPVPAGVANALEESKTTYNNSDYNVAVWGISSALILLILTVASWFFGWVYSLVKK